MGENERKERYEAVTMQFHEPVRINCISIATNGQFEIFDDKTELMPHKISYEKGIEREKKNKRTLSCEIVEKNINIYNVLYDFDYLVALDTNSDKGISSAVGIIYRIIRSATDRSQFTMIYVSGIQNVFESQEGADISSELVALNSLIQYLQTGRMLNDFSEKRTLIIIDHNLGKMDSFNSKLCPLIEGDKTSFLPNNVRLMYASADKYNDSLFNRIIKDCDKEATFLLKQRINSL